MNPRKKTVSAVIRKAPITVGMQDTVQQVEAVMDAQAVSSVPVMDTIRGDCFGIISLRDIHRFHAEKRNPKTVRAWEMCTYRPLLVQPTTTIAEAAQLMVDNSIHHLVVVEKDKIRGFVSSLDLLRYCALK